LDVVNNGDISIFAAESRSLALISVREYPEDRDGIPRETALANARLIAAAPELLFAAKAMVELDDGDQPFAWKYASEFMQLREAIAKAEGRSSLIQRGDPTEPRAD